jgi:hypothetical protein
MRSIGQPCPSSRSATPIASSIRQDELETAVARPSYCGRDGGFGIHRIDDDAAEPMPVESDGDGEADQAPTKDDYVGALHFPGLAMQGCNAKRLTGESGRAH